MTSINTVSLGSKVVDVSSNEELKRFPVMRRIRIKGLGMEWDSNARVYDGTVGAGFGTFCASCRKALANPEYSFEFVDQVPSP